MPPKHKAKIILEVMYKADYCLPCYYMDESSPVIFSVKKAFTSIAGWRRFPLCGSMENCSLTRFHPNLNSKRLSRRF